MTFRPLLDLHQFDVERSRQNLYATPIRDIAPLLSSSVGDRMKLLNIMAFQIQIQNSSMLNSQTWDEWQQAFTNVGVTSEEVEATLSHLKSKGSKKNQQNIAAFALVFGALLKESDVALHYIFLDRQKTRVHTFSMRVLRQWHSMVSPEMFTNIFTQIPLVDPQWKDCASVVTSNQMVKFLQTTQLPGKTLHDLYSHYSKYGTAAISDVIKTFYHSDALDRYNRYDFYHHAEMEKSGGTDYESIEDLYYQESLPVNQRMNMTRANDTSKKPQRTFAVVESFLEKIPEYYRKQVAVEIIEHLPIDDAVFYLSEAAKQQPNVLPKYMNAKDYASPIQKILRATYYIAEGKPLTEYTIDNVFGFTTPQEVLNMPGATLQEKFEHAMSMHCGKDTWDYLNSTGNLLRSFESNEMILPRMLELSLNKIRELTIPALHDFTY